MVTEKYLELLSRENPEYILERLYLLEYKRAPQKYYIRGGKINSTLIELTEEWEEPKLKYEYDIQKLFRTLRDSENFLEILDTPYCIGGSVSYVILMKDAIIRIEAILTSKYGKELWIYTHKDPEEYAKLVEWEDHGEPDSINFYFLTQRTYGKLIESKMEMSRIEVDIEKNYNQDLPLPRIREFIESSSPGLIILNGEPGTGKSSLIKYLISEYPSKRWVVVPSRLLLKCGEGDLVDYFMKGRDQVYVLEDCENLIFRREKGNNLETFLNLTDGLIGDALNPKFICTFNTPLSNVDPALLRKGRLKLRYEFRPLSLEKTRIHIPEADSPMNLSDIYNRAENGGEVVRKKVGY